MRFNMGCGHNHAKGLTNVDAAAACNPDEVWDLERTPWPWPDNCATEVYFIHSLEHMGGDSQTFLAIMCELYRIAAPGCEVVIHAPHPRHDDFLDDPTHVRVVTPGVLRLFDRELNDQWKAQRVANTTLAHYLGVDFKLTEARVLLNEPYRTAMQEGEMTEAELRTAVAERNNVVREFRMKLVARKPAA